jgi:VWFA-related protein
MFLSSRRAAAGLPVLAMVLCLVLAGQCSYAQRGGTGRPNVGSNKSPYTIPVTVRRVVLDVVVTDSQGKAVHGLKKKDFAVFENKKQQEIRTFEENDFNASPQFVAPKLPPMPPDTYVNVATTPESGPLYVIVYDSVHMEFGPGDSMDQGDQVRARKQLATFLASKPAGTRFALFLLGTDFRLLQGFTTDQNKLLEVFDVHRKGSHIPYALLTGANVGKDDTVLPFEVMAFLGHYLEGLPGRKNLIWMSSQFPAEVPMIGIQAAQVGNTMSAPSGSPLQAQGFDGSAGTTLGDTWSAKILREAIDSLNAAQVSVYPVDVAGLKPDAAAGGIDTIADNIAAATGGHAYYNTNDISGAILSATEDGSSYYEITYSPNDYKEDGKMRNIRVAPSHKGYNLEYRRYYYAEDPDAPLTNDEKRVAMAVADQVVAHKPGDSMYAYMQHGAPIDHDIVFRAQFRAGPVVQASPEQMANLVEQPAYFVIRKKDKPVKLPSPVPLQAYSIDYLVLDQSAEAHAGGQVLEFAAAVYNSDGKLLNGIAQNAVRAQTTVDQKSGQQVPFFRAVQTLDVPTTAVWLRVAVRDVNTDRIGTLEIPLPLASNQPSVATGQTAPAGAATGSNPNQ